MVTNTIFDIVKKLGSHCTVEQVMKEAEAMGIEDKFVIDSLGRLASEGHLRIKGGKVTLR